MSDERDPTAGLPDDLAAILRDPSIIVPQDQAVFEAIAKAGKHLCPWCPAEVRNLYACAYNAVVNYGTERERKKMRDLLDAVNQYRQAVDEHFAAALERPETKCAHLPGCQVRPGGLFHDEGCPER